jgi:hypothetical protein
LISLGFSSGTVTLYDAATLDLIAGPLHAILVDIPVEGRALGDTIFLTQPHAVVTSPDGSMAVLTSRNGVIGLSLPSLDLLFNPLTGQRSPPRHVVRDRAGENYYVSAEGDDVVRLSASGEPKALFMAERTEAIALTRDEERILVLADSGNRLAVLNVPDLSLRMNIDLPLTGAVIVPLKQNDMAIILGGTGGGGTASRTPLMALPVDLASGTVGSLQVLCCEQPGGLTFLFGDGNQWAEVGEATAIVPTAVGTVTINTDAGTVDLQSAVDLQNDVPPCCDIAAYPRGDHVAITSAAFTGGSGTPGGSIIVYQVEERLLSATD